MMTWMQSGTYNSIDELMSVKTGLSVGDLLSYEVDDPRTIENMWEAANAVVRAIWQKPPITIVGDYDADGINATAILLKMFSFYGVPATPIIPKRMSEGYGLSQDIIDRIDNGLVITVDNGISAVEEIRMLKEKGCQVIILDHHLPSDVLPPADIIVNPHVNPGNNKFCFYCGAGLSLQMALLILEQNQSLEAAALRNELVVHAAIATVADVMPLVGMNRTIVKTGLALLNNNPQDIGAGLNALRKAANVDEFTEESIGFKLGPLINAPARLYNAGGSSVLKAMTCRNMDEAAVYTEKMVQINERRKSIVQESLLIAERQIEAMNLLGQGAPLCVLCPNVPEGIIGIVAGKLSEKYGIPTFVFTETGGEGVLKGSGRAGNNANLEPMLRAIQPIALKCGGHSGAAGISVNKSDYQKLVQAMHSMAAEIIMESNNVLYYDFEIGPEYVPAAFQEVRKFAPFGEGVPKPVFLVRAFQPEVRFGSHYRIIGSEKNHVKLNGSIFDALCFDMAEKYISQNCPATLDLLCTLGENVYNGKRTLQAEVIDFRAAGTPCA